MKSDNDAISTCPFKKRCTLVSLIYNQDSEKKKMNITSTPIPDDGDHFYTPEDKENRLCNFRKLVS